MQINYDFLLDALRKPKQFFALAFLVLLFASTEHRAQSSTTCVPATTYGCTDDDYIDAFSMAGVATVGNSGCQGGTAGYTLFATPVRTLMAGQSYTWSVTMTTVYTEKFALWIDLDNDGNYSASEQLVTQNTAAGAFSGTITIPVNAATGTNIAMRTRCKYDGTWELAAIPLHAAHVLTGKLKITGS